MKAIFWERLILILMGVSSILFCVGFALMLINNGVIHVSSSRVPVDEELIYDGAYIDLLDTDQQSDSLGKGEIRVTRIDTETGFPAASELALVDGAGRKVTNVNLVRFNYQGMPAMLRFTNNVADGFAYQNTASSLFEKGCLDNMWETNPDFLRQALADYTAQVSALVE